MNSKVVFGKSAAAGRGQPASAIRFDWLPLASVGYQVPHLALEYLTMISACTHLGRQGLRFANDCLEVVILPGGGHIAKVALLSGPSAGSNPLWELPWPTVDPSLRRAAILQTDVYCTAPTRPELLCSTASHNLAADVFGVRSTSPLDLNGCSLQVGVASRAMPTGHDVAG